MGYVLVVALEHLCSRSRRFYTCVLISDFNALLDLICSTPLEHMPPRPTTVSCHSLRYSLFHHASCAISGIAAEPTGSLSQNARLMWCFGRYEKPRGYIGRLLATAKSQLCTRKARASAPPKKKKSIFPSGPAKQQSCKARIVAIFPNE